MSKIYIEKKEIKFKVKETIENTSFEVVDGKYVENTTLNRQYISDIYPYLDFNVLFAMENMFDEFYIKIILFNDEKKLKYNLISVPNSLDVSVKRVSAKNFLVLGINRDQGTKGQASFCSLLDDGNVAEAKIMFNYINQYKVLENRYFLLNFIEIFDEKEKDDENNEKTSKKYVNNIAIYREDGSVHKILFNETLSTKRELVCDINNDNLMIYYKDDGSLVKRTTVSEILLSGNQ